LRQYLAQVKESGIADVRSRRSDVYTLDWGDTALVTLVLDQTYTLGGERHSLHAPTSLVLRREDGAWRIALVHSVPLTEAG
jgi:ketosteroid isomerase-like protein